MRKSIWTPANIISLARIGAAPIILILLYLERYVNGDLSPHQVSEAQHLWILISATTIYVLAALSDTLDGYLARSRGEVTTIGKFLDPLADKIVVTTVFVMYAKFGWAPAWLVILIILREITITAMRSMASSEGKVIAAGPWGKAKMLTQNFAIPFLMVHYNHYGIPFHLIGTILLYAALILTLYSGWDYMNKYFSSRNQK